MYTLALTDCTLTHYKIIDKLRLSYSNSSELNKIVDTLPSSPSFDCNELMIAGEPLQFHCRDLVQCIKYLFGNPAYAECLVFALERHYADHERKCQVYNELHTRDWWWSVQVRSSTVKAPPMVGPTWTRVRLILGSDCLPILFQGTVLPFPLTKH